MGAVHESDTRALPGVAVNSVGVPGAVAGGGNGAVGVADITVDTEPIPAELAAVIRNWYAVPFVRPVTVAMVPVPAPSEYVAQLAVLPCL